MKRLIRSSQEVNTYKNLKYLKASSEYDYTDHYTVKVDDVKFSVYTKYADDADNFQCEISELHPYDDAEYAWARKDLPAAATVYKNGKKYGIIEVREYDDEADEEYKGNEEKFNRDIVNYICKQLRVMNKDVKPVMVHN